MYDLRIHKEKINKLLKIFDESLDVIKKDNIICTNLFRIFILDDSKFCVMFNLDISPSTSAILINELQKIIEKVINVSDGYFIVNDEVITESYILERNTGYKLKEQAYKDFNLKG